MSISLTFTYLLVIRPVEFFSNQKQNTNLTTTQDSGVQVKANYTAEDVFRPTRIVLTHNNKFEMSSSGSIMREVNSLLNKRFSHLTRQNTISGTEYENLVLREAHTQFLFDGMPSFGILSRYFDAVGDEFTNETFSRMIIRSDDPQTVYFVNEETRQLYSAKVDDSFKNTVDALYKDEDFYEVDSYQAKNRQLFVEQTEVTADQTAYLIEQIPVSFYIGQLFSNPSEIRTRGDGKTVVYNDNLSQLKLDRTTNIVTFFENRAGEEKLPYTENLTQTLNQMKRLGGWQLGISLSSVDSNNIVEYVRYVDSYPILSSAKEGLTQVKASKNGIEKMRTSSLIAQTPLPSKNKKVKVISGKEIVAEILSEGFVMKDIEDLRIGYSWSISSENNQIVEFTPKWYIKKDNTWRTIEELKASKNAPDNNGAQTVSGGDPDGF